MRAVEVRLQNASMQAGIEKNPVIQWQYGEEDAGKRQSSYQIQILKEKGEICADTGEINSSEQNNIEIPMELKSLHGYEIQVKVKSQDGEEEWGETGHFISGVQPGEWKGRWIGAGSSKPFYVGKEIFLERKIKSAYMAVCGLGQFQIRVNQEQAGEGCLYGSWTDFEKRLHYWVFDVSGQVRQGVNEICMEVGNGWYIGDTSEGRHFYTMNHRYHAFGTELTGIIQMRIVYEDGTEELVVTDESWGTWESPVTLANAYGAEDYDGEKACTWEELFLLFKKNKVKILSEEEKPQGCLVPALYPPVKILRTYSGKLLKKAGRKYLYDLGQNMSGFFEVTAKGEKGTILKITSAEKIDTDGNIVPSTNTWSIWKMQGKGEIESYCPRFTYGAGRWILVEILQAPENCEPQIESVNGHFISSGAKDTGKFSCSDKRYEEIHQLVKCAVESNLNHVHTDCPTVERMGWLEPNHLMGPSIMYLKNVETLWDKIGDDMRDAQYGEEEEDVDLGEFPHVYGAGLIPSIAPRYAKFIVDCGAGSFWDIIPWGSSLLLAEDLLADFYGNTRVIKKNYLAAAAYVEYLWKKYEDYPKIYGKDGTEHFLCHGLGDWGTDRKEGECRENVETAYLYYDLCVLGKWANDQKDKERENWAKACAERVKREYNQSLLQKDESGIWYYGGKGELKKEKMMGNQALPLYLGMVPEDKEKDVKQTFLDLAEKGKIQSGEICLRYIFCMLSQYGKNEWIEKMIMQKEHPSYYRFIEKGETTLPEFWSDDARSRNHDMMGHIMEWFYREVGGIYSRDGFKTVEINPHFVGNLSWIRCAYDSIAGKIEVFLQKKENRCTMEVRIPTNMEAAIHLPEEKVSVCGGIHRFGYLV